MSETLVISDNCRCCAVCRCNEWIVYDQHGDAVRGCELCYRLLNTELIDNTLTDAWNFFLAVLTNQPPYDGQFGNSQGLDRTSSTLPNVQFPVFTWDYYRPPGFTYAGTASGQFWVTCQTDLPETLNTTTLRFSGLSRVVQNLAFNNRRIWRVRSPEPFVTIDNTSGQIVNQSGLDLWQPYIKDVQPFLWRFNADWELGVGVSPSSYTPIGTTQLQITTGNCTLPTTIPDPGFPFRENVEAPPPPEEQTLSLTTLSNTRQENCIHLGIRQEFRSGCSGWLCRHACDLGLPAVPGGYCQTCDHYEADSQGG